MTSNEAKQRRKAKHYSQVKVSVDKDLADSFRQACSRRGVSMAGAISAFMGEYTKAEKPAHEWGAIGTRQQRRKTLGKLTGHLRLLKEAEEAYAGSIPENLRGSVRFEAAEQCLEALDEAISLLDEAY